MAQEGHMKNIKQVILVVFVVVCFTLVGLTVVQAFQEAQVSGGELPAGYQVNAEATDQPTVAPSSTPQPEAGTAGQTATPPYLMGVEDEA
jgi:hypothetical protein